MNWIKKLFKVLQPEDTKSMEEVPDYHDQKRSTLKKQMRDNGKDVNAKIVYQYPKGEFRFPLIPDQVDKSKNSSTLYDKRQSRSKQERSTSLKSSKQIVSKTKNQQKNQDVEPFFVKQRTKSNKEPSYIYQKPKEKKESVIKHEQPKQRSGETLKQQAPEREGRLTRPFAPSEIPSPIYGFKERPISEKSTEEIIEYELQSFEAPEQAAQGTNHSSQRQPIVTISDSENVINHINDFVQPIIEVDEVKTEVENNHEAPEQVLVEPENEIEEVLQFKEELEATNEVEIEIELEEPVIELSEEPIINNESVVENNHEAPEQVLVEPENEIEEVLQFKEELEEPVIELSEEPIINNESVVKNNHEAPEQVFVEPENEIEEMLQFKEELEATNEVEIEIELEEPVIELSEEPIINNESVVENNHEAPEQTPLENHGIKIEEELPENLKIALSLEKQEFRIENSDEDNIESNHEEVESVIQSELKPESTSEQQKERPSIPFNVIMLKQDKQKLMMKESSPLSGQETIIEKTQPQEQEAQKVLEFEKLEETKESENEETFYTVNNDMIQMEEVETTKHFFPPIDLLNPPLIVEGNDEWIDEQAQLLDSTLKNFNVGAQVVKVTQGPAVTRFEVQPEPGVKVNKITNLSDDIKLSLAARDIRIEAPIPGKHTIGIEVPNQKSRAVNISEIINHMEFEQKESPLTAVLGLDISGKPVVTDLRKMPHGLIAGATGSGKSVCINTILISLLYKATPNELKLLLIDPKMVELAPYNHIPHLVSPVITDVKAATASLKWAVEEMERRYELFAHSGVRDIGRFNELAKQHRQFADILPYIVIVIDELADLMMMSPADVEEAISRIAQKARACGIHLIIATQRPSVDVITGLIKANIPTRIAFSVSSQIDSRTIIDISGAEKLLGRGDMLFLENGASKPVRIQGTFVSDDEIDQVVAHVRTQGEPEYLFQQEELLKKAQVEEDGDELFYEACEFVVDHGGASTSLLQRRFKIGYNRAARLIDLMEVHGYISESKGSKPRDVFLTDTDLEALQ